MEELLDLFIKLQKRYFYLNEIEKDEFGYSIILYNAKKHYFIYINQYLCIYCNQIEDDVIELTKEIKKVLKNINKGVNL